MSIVEMEHVLVVPTEVFHRLGHFQGFSGEFSNYLDELLSGEHVSYRPRGDMEQDPNFKQLIPYVIFRHVDADGNESIFQYTRGAGQGESRLHRKLSIGVGGHISTTDQCDATNASYREGMLREMREEVHLGTSYAEQIVGLINDDETEVGRVHLGIVHLLDVDEPQIESREADLLEAGFLTVDRLAERAAEMESWSRICLAALYPAPPLS